MTSYPFLRWRPPAILDLIWVMLDHPRSAIVCLSLILKFDLDPIYSFGEWKEESGKRVVEFLLVLYFAILD